MGYQVFAVAPSVNSKDQCDASGAFIPGAQKLAAAYNGGFKTFENVGSRIKKNFLDTIESGPGSLDLFAYFGHGYDTQLGSANIITEKDLDDFVVILQKKIKVDAIVVLYACLAGKSGGFSTKLQEKLGQKVWVYGHTTVGHSYMNPDVSEVQGVRSPRFRVLFENSPLKAAWQESLVYTDMWLRFPIMWDEYIIRELNAIRLLGKWQLPNGSRYTFEWSKQNEKYSSLADINKNPNGTVKDEKSNLKGTWTIGDSLIILWEGKQQEVWTMPIEPTGQTIYGISGLAKRLSHTKPSSKTQG